MHRSIFEGLLHMYTYDAKCINPQKFYGEAFCQNCHLRTSILNNCARRL